jgi:hypothetical protein
MKHEGMKNAPAFTRARNHLQCEALAGGLIKGRKSHILRYASLSQINQS